ncbi:hypothetical protein V2J09_023049 [Rumex salicifolius]
MTRSLPEQKFVKDKEKVWPSKRKGLSPEQKFAWFKFVGLKFTVEETLVRAEEEGNRWKEKRWTEAMRERLLVLEMTTESMELFKSRAVPSNDGSYSTDGHVHLGSNGVQENEHLDLLNDFESYYEEINDRLIIFRLVNDSVVKAVLGEAAEMVVVKELQSTGLKEQLLERRMVQQIQEEIELILVQSTFHNIKEEYEKRLPSSQFDGNKRKICSDKLKQVSTICKDLDAVQKLLSNLEQLSTHGSLDSDYSLRRVANNSLLSSSSLWDRNGSNEEPIVKLPENFESSALKDTPPVQLYSHLRDMIINIKRDHETNIQEMTEEYFILKREFLKERELLKERGYLLPHKSKDFDVLKKRIPDVISKLNEIVNEDQDFSEMCDLLRDEYNSLLMENHHLSDVINDKEREAKCLSSQVSEVKEKLTQKLLSEAQLSKKIEDLETLLHGAQLDLVHQKCEEEENKMKAIIIQETIELIYREALYDTEAKMSSECGELSNIQTVMAQEILGVTYQEAMKDMEMQLDAMHEKYLEMDELVISLESKASDMREDLALKSKQKLNLEQKILQLETLVEEKAKLKFIEKEQLDQELNKLMKHIEEQDVVIFSRNNELKELKVNLEQSLQQVHLYNNQVQTLTETLQKAQLESQIAILQERDKVSLFIDMKNREYKKLILSVVQELTKAYEGFEHKIARSIKANCHRLEDSRFQLGSLTRKAKMLRMTELRYKEKLERSLSNQQKAEDEVDLLGDELETLQGLLEKIYIALDHYSPVLQHYSGYELGRCCLTGKDDALKSSSAQNTCSFVKE